MCTDTGTYCNGTRKVWSAAPLDCGALKFLAFTVFLEPLSACIYAGMHKWTDLLAMTQANCQSIMNAVWSEDPPA